MYFYTTTSSPFQTIRDGTNKFPRSDIFIFVFFVAVVRQRLLQRVFLFAELAFVQRSVVVGSLHVSEEKFLRGKRSFADGTVFDLLRMSGKEMRLFVHAVVEGLLATGNGTLHFRFLLFGAGAFFDRIHAVGE